MIGFWQSHFMRVYEQNFPDFESYLIPTISIEFSGLFHQAICQSGTAKSIWAQIPRHVAQKRANAIATMAGCVFQSIEENVKCLRQVPAEDLVRISKSLQV